MMFKMVLFMVAGVTLLTGCKPDFLTINNLHALRKGMSRAEVGEALPKEATMTRSVTVKGIPYTVDDFPLQTAQAKSEMRTYNAYTGSTTIMTNTTDYTNVFLLVYDGLGLRYWGMIADFDKSEDPAMQDVAPFIYNLYVTP